MRSIKHRFEDYRASYPLVSSYIALARAVTGQGFSRDRICRNFDELVEKDDYQIYEKKGLIDHLVSLTNTPRSARKTLQISLMSLDMNCIRESYQLPLERVLAI